MESYDEWLASGVYQYTEAGNMKPASRHLLVEWILESCFCCNFIFRRAHFFHNYNIVFDGHSLLPFSRGELSLEVGLDHG